jgi:peptidyl-prolyl cis-trans isomerase A (cyclophilin A)
MQRRIFLAGTLGLIAHSAWAQTETPSATSPPEGPPLQVPVPKPAKGVTRVRIETALGGIVVELRGDKAPVTAANFLRYVDQKRYDKANFYRASRPPNATDYEYGVVQGGLQNDPKLILPPIAHESTTKTGLKHTNGAISMGRRALGTATSDFFICVGDQAYLDADPTQPGDNKGFACFGYVVEGLETVKKIMASPLSPTAGVGVMKGEMFRKPLAMKVRRA